MRQRLAQAQPQNAPLVQGAVLQRKCALSPKCEWEVQKPPGYVPEGLGESGLGAFLGGLGGALLGGLVGLAAGGPLGAGIGMMVGTLVGVGAGLLIGHYAR